MPKRAEAYMASQRDHLAAVVFDLIKEFGLHEVTLRKICERAGISMGAFYVHFSSKEEAVDAALVLNAERAETPPMPQSWAEFEAQLYESANFLSDPDKKKLVRLSFEYTAMILATDADYQAPSFTSELGIEYMQRLISRFQELGEIDASLDPERLARQIISIMHGASYLAALVPEFRDQRHIDEVVDAVRKVAGRKT